MAHGEVTRPSYAPKPSGCRQYFGLIAVSIWILLVTAGVQLVAWLVESAQTASGPGLPGRTWLVISWVQAFLLALPLMPMAARSRDPRLAAVYRTWALASVAIFILAGARTFTILQSQQAMTAQALLSLLCAALVYVALGRRRRPSMPHGSLIPAALVVAALVVIPQLLWGALGSRTETLLAITAGLSFGLLGGLLLDLALFVPMSTAIGTAAAGRDPMSGGSRGLMIFGAGTALFILAGGFGNQGTQILLMVALPPLAISLAGIASLAALRGRPGASAGAWLPAALLTGALVAAFLAFWDPDELTPLLGSGEILSWALRSAEVALVVAALAGWLVWRIYHRAVRADAVPANGNEGMLQAGSAGEARMGAALGALPRGRSSLWWAAAALAAWVAALAVYFVAGQPGFYGDQFFVILRDQADVAPAYQIADRAERSRYVYNTLVDHADATQKGLRALLSDGNVGYRPYYLVNAIEVNGEPALRTMLTARPEVDRIIDSQRLRPLPGPLPVDHGSEAAPSGPEWNITAIGADRVWQELGVTGRGIVVGQSDSGVQGDHPALAEGYRGRGGNDDYNWLDPWYGTRHPVDSGGHGTHTLGTVLGRGGIGVAPDAEWMACVNLARNLGSPGRYLDCMQFLLAPYPQGKDAFRDGDPARGAQVLNNSWGCPPIEGCDPNALAPATTALRAAGIFVVVSAGNGGPACGSVNDPPALYGNVVSVGAVDRASRLAFFSSRGPVTADGSDRTKPDIVAPGVDVLSAFPGSTYTLLEGTSMAGPHVVGVVALMWSAQPKLVGNIDRTTEILLQSARPYTGSLDGCATGSGRPNNDAGYGLVDAYAAVKAALAEK